MNDKLDITPKAVQVKARFIIELYSDGRVNINHPPDRILAYGLLSIAQEILVAQNINRSSKSNIITPTMVPPKM